MRRGAPALILLLGLSSCERERLQSVGTIEEPAELLSSIQAGVPGASPQFVSGFYQIENGAFRWTRGRFAIVLAVPEGVEDSGAVLELTFRIPEVLIEREGATQLSAVVEDISLDPERYDKPGDYAYRRALPASALHEDLVYAEFSLDTFLAAGAIESRELGLAVVSAAVLPE